MIDRSRPLEDRMLQARRYCLHRLKAATRRPPNYAALMEAAAEAVKAKMPGWTLRPEPTRDEILADFRRVVRRNILTKGRLP